MGRLDSTARAGLALLAVYLASASGHLMSMDGLYMLHQSYALLFDGSVRFQSPLWTWRDEPTWNSLYGIGLSLLYLPGLFVVAPLRAWIPASASPPPNRYAFYLRELYEDPVYLLGASWVHAVVTALAAMLAGRLVLALGYSRRAALWTMAFYGVGSSALVYARGDFAQPLEGLCWVGALLAAVRWRDGRAGAAALAAAALAVLFAVLVRPVEGALLAPAVGALLLPGRAAIARPSSAPSSERSSAPPNAASSASSSATPTAPSAVSLSRALAPAAGIAAGALAGVVLTLLVNVARHGSALDFGYPAGNRWEWPEWSRWAAVLVSPGRGVAWEFPALLLVPFGVAAAWRAGRRHETAAMLALAGLLLVNVTTWAAWWGGWCWGLRLFLPALPLLAVFAGIAMDAQGRRVPSAVGALLVAAGLAWVLPAICADILAGYGAGTEGVPNGWHWSWSSYPPIGAWPSIRRVFATSPTDSLAVDVLWFRLAAVHGSWVLAVPALLLAAAAALARSALRVGAPLPSPR